MVFHCLSVVCVSSRVRKQDVEEGEGRRGKAYLVDYTIPGETCVVDDDVDFTIAEFSSLFDEYFEVGVI